MSTFPFTPEQFFEAAVVFDDNSPGHHTAVDYDTYLSMLSGWLHAPRPVLSPRAFDTWVVALVDRARAKSLDPFLVAARAIHKNYPERAVDALNSVLLVRVGRSSSRTTALVAAFHRAENWHDYPPPCFVPLQP